jgi:hypothetical protein
MLSSPPVCECAGSVMTCMEKTEGHETEDDFCRFMACQDISGQNRCVMPIWTPVTESSAIPLLL